MLAAFLILGFVLLVGPLALLYGVDSRAAPRPHRPRRAAQGCVPARVSGGGFIRAVSVKEDARGDYALDIPAIRNLGRLELDPAVTFLVGENGSGKSTLVEAIAVAAGL